MADYSVSGEEKYQVPAQQFLGGTGGEDSKYEGGDIVSRSNFPDPAVFERFIKIGAIKPLVGLDVQQELRAELDRVKAELEASRAGGVTSAAAVSGKSAKDK